MGLLVLFGFILALVGFTLVSGIVLVWVARKAADAHRVRKIVAAQGGAGPSAGANTLISALVVALVIAFVVYGRARFVELFSWTHSAAPAVTAPAPAVDMSPAAQASAGAACKQLVGTGGRLEEHRRGNTGFSPDRVLLYGWGEMNVRESKGVGYEVNMFVDTLTGYSGNIVRTPITCLVREDSDVVSLNFGGIQFPQK